MDHKDRIAQILLETEKDLFLLAEKFFLYDVLKYILEAMHKATQRAMRP